MTRSMSPTRRPGPGVAALACLLALHTATGLACARRPKPVEYSLPQGAVLPIGSVPPTDARARFADVFCRVLAGTTAPDGTPWNTCDQYLAGARPAPAGELPPVPTGLEALFVGGVFSQCLERADVPLRTFDDVREHFEQRLGIASHYVPVHPNGSVEQNARAIAAWLADRPGEARFVAFGHSKGGLDLLEAVYAHADVARRIVALVTLATPFGGSRLPDLFSARLAGLPDEMTSPTRCRSTLEWGSGAMRDLRRDVRQLALARRPAAPACTPVFSLAAVAATETAVSSLLRPLWRKVAPFSIDQDSQVVAEEAVPPGATFLGRGLGDHWAVAFPVERLHGVKRWARAVDRNRYPRPALAEAALRLAGAAQRPGGCPP